MNIYKNIIFLIAFVFSIMAVNAQDKNAVATAKFGVSGNCEMCKKTIESALDVKGVKSATWNDKTKIIEVAYQPSKITEVQLHELIAATGYDTDQKKAKENAYKALPECCQYSRKK